MTEPHERPRLLALDLLESYARERDLYVMLERVSQRDDGWVCVIKSGPKGLATRTVGGTAREAIIEALQHEGVKVPS